MKSKFLVFFVVFICSFLTVSGSNIELFSVALADSGNDGGGSDGPSGVYGTANSDGSISPNGHNAADVSITGPASDPNEHANEFSGLGPDSGNQEHANEFSGLQAGDNPHAPNTNNNPPSEAGNNSFGGDDDDDASVTQSGSNGNGQTATVPASQTVTPSEPFDHRASRISCLNDRGVDPDSYEIIQNANNPHVIAVSYFAEHADSEVCSDFGHDGCGWCYVRTAEQRRTACLDNRGVDPDAYALEDHPNVDGDIIAVFFSDHVDVIHCSAGSTSVFGNDGCGLCRTEILDNSVQSISEPIAARSLNTNDLQEGHEYSIRKNVGVTGVRFVRGRVLFEEDASLAFNANSSIGSTNGLREATRMLNDALSRHNTIVTAIELPQDNDAGGPTLFVNDFCDYSDADKNGGWGYNHRQQTGERCPPENNPNPAPPAQTTPEAATPETPQECRDARGIDRNAYIIMNRHGAVEYSADHPHRRNCNLVGGDNFGSDGCGVCSIEGVNEEPAPAPEQATEPVSQGNGGAHPHCRNGSNSDSDGDGYGWENGGSCIVVTTQQTVNNPSTHSSGKPYCLDAATADYDGDGYGWENNETCIVRNSAADK